MYKVLNCLAVEHELHLVALAACICFLSSVTAIALFHRARALSGNARRAWLITAGASAGCGIWATHFIAMLAYDPGKSVSYDLVLTGLSLVLAVAVTTTGLWVAISRRSAVAATIGGGVVGAGIAIMHYTGMQALQVPGWIAWDASLVVASVMLGVVLGMASLGVATRSDQIGRTLCAAGLLTASIVAMHFTGMGAVEIIPDPTRVVDPQSISPTTMALALGNAAIAILGMSLAGAYADRRLRLKDRQFVTAVNNMAQGLVMFDPDERMVVCNDRYLEMYNLSPDVVKPGCMLADVIAQRIDCGSLLRDPEEYRAELVSAMAGGEISSWTVESEDGRVIYTVNRPMGNGYWVGTHDDITDRKRAERLIAHMAYHDSLTDLPNRKAFNEHLESTLAEAVDENGAFAVLCIDFDRFKEINDVFGHATGDALLQQMAARLQEAAGEEFVARLGGDEFTIIAVEGAQPQAAEALSARLLASAARDFEVGGHVLKVGLSIGVAIYPVDGEDMTTLLANADAALYRAKADGRGTVRFFQPSMDENLRERRALQHDLRSAIDRGELSIHYQPQTDISGQIGGFEALARWTHPDRGMISPDVFIPIAEEAGSIIEIGEWIMREACREAASWVHPLSIAINLSPIQFRHGDLPGLIHQVLVDTGLSPARLEVEITEGVLIGDHARALAILRRIKALGVRIAMDDFGTGYSSLSYLQSFPFDKIKIDQAFIGNLMQSGQSAAIIRAVIGLGRGLDLPVVAEGVETEGQLAFLVAESCQGVQGHLIGRPAPIDAYCHLIGRAAPSGVIAGNG